MRAIELDLYELLKLKLGEKETKAFFTLIEHKVEAVEHKIEEQKNSLATKHDIEKTKSDLTLEIERVKAEMLVMKWMLGAVLAGIISLILKAYFP